MGPAGLGHRIRSYDFEQRDFEQHDFEQHDEATQRLEAICDISSPWIRRLSGLSPAPL
jgi:hypothetical protein